jgi:hypothetical protein
MLIEERTYHADKHRRTLNPHSTMLRFNNTVRSPEEADIIVYSAYQVNESIIGIENYYNKTIILDFSTELFAEDRYEELLLHKSLRNLKIYTNGLPPNIQSFKPLELRGAEIVEVPFFLKYMNYYSPMFKGEKVDHKNFLIYVGKLRPERVALIGLLSYYNLLNNNHVSFIRGNRNFGRIPIDDYFKTDSPDEQKEMVRYGLDKITGDLTLDTRILSHEISHDRKYVADYYQNVDFVIVCETEVLRPVKFITEKTVKCIQQNKKFILLGSEGLLSYIRIQAKLHLNKDISPLVDWCDTSYDNIENPWERINKIVDIIRNEVNLR